VEKQERSDRRWGRVEQLVGQEAYIRSCRALHLWFFLWVNGESLGRFEQKNGMICLKLFLNKFFIRMYSLWGGGEFIVTSPIRLTLSVIDIAPISFPLNKTRSIMTLLRVDSKGQRRRQGYGVHYQLLPTLSPALWPWASASTSSFRVIKSEVLVSFNFQCINSWRNI
jgi:hypothetical protein